MNSELYRSYNPVLRGRHDVSDGVLRVVSVLRLGVRLVARLHVVIVCSEEEEAGTGADSLFPPTTGSAALLKAECQRGKLVF